MNEIKKMISGFTINMGCDPELFFRKEREIVGAEKVLPRSGLSAGDSKVIIDGVQGELNPAATYCREILAKNIQTCFFLLREALASHERVKIDFSTTVKLTKKDLDNLSDDSKKLGCMPSKNANLEGKEGKVSVKGEIYPYRSAGGHIHIGNYGQTPVLEKVLKKQPLRLVRMLDLLVGNTCVLIDRDPGNVERRKVYGRAGEFRTPPHGVEYRVLSNFWLRSYQTMSLVFGLVRHAIAIVASDLDEEFTNLVDMDDVAKAINNNDYKLALKNFNKIKSLLMERTQVSSFYSIHAGNMADFMFFIEMGLDHWFSKDSMKHWTGEYRATSGNHNFGFNDWMNHVVRPQRLDAKK